MPGKFYNYINVVKIQIYEPLVDQKIEVYLPLLYGIGHLIVQLTVIWYVSIVSVLCFCSSFISSIVPSSRASL
jgi:ABC-type lipoprotein release transport system permease subunit